MSAADASVSTSANANPAKPSESPSVRKDRILVLGRIRPPSRNGEHAFFVQVEMGAARFKAVMFPDDLAQPGMPIFARTVLPYGQREECPVVIGRKSKPPREIEIVHQLTRFEVTGRIPEIVRDARNRRWLSPQMDGR
jgi:hypothetical protein